MTDSNYYLEDEDDYFNPTISERAIPGPDHVVASKLGGVEPPYQDLAFAVLARVLAPDEATVERVAAKIKDAYYRGGTMHTAADDAARAVLAALAEDLAVTS